MCTFVLLYILQNYIKIGQNILYRELKWGIVHPCSSNGSRDVGTSKNFEIFTIMSRKFAIFYKPPINWEIYIFTSFAVSSKLFEPQRCTIPHVNSLQKICWPMIIQFCSKKDIFQDIKQNKCTIFFLRL